MASWSWSTLVLFATVLVVGYFCLNQYDLRGKYEGKEWLLLGITPGAILLALRSATVGRDLVNYKLHIRYFESYAIKGFFSEPLMNLLEGISNHTGGLHTFIILSSLIEFLFIYKALSNLHKREVCTRLVYTLYFIYIVIRSTSMVSNGIGLASAFCAISYLIGESNEEGQNTSKRDTIMYFIYTVIGIGFHNSVIYNLLLYILCKPINVQKSVKYQIILKVLILISGVGFVLLYSKGIFNAFIRSIANEEYSRFSAQDSVSFGIGNIAIRLPIILIVFYYWPYIKGQHGEKFDSFKYLLILDMITAQLKYISQDFERLTMLTGIGTIILLSVLYESLKDRTKGILKILMPLFVCAYLTYTLYKWGITNNYGIMPYTFWS